MGVCASSSNPDGASASDHFRFPAPSTGSCKYGPYVRDSSAAPSAASGADTATRGYHLRSLGDASALGLPAMFASEKELRAWLLCHVTVEKQTGTTVVRSPGTLCGAQFIIADCEDCDIRLLDHTSTVSVDRCKGCRILIGPCDSSVFIRDCRDCTFAIATRQLRMRDCRDIDMRLFCGTAPVIEKTRRLRLACWEGGWFEFERQLEVCALSPFQNRWAQVHDFTPGGSCGGGQNWSLVDGDGDAAARFRALDGHLRGSAGGGDVIPVTRWAYTGATSPDDDVLLFDATPRGLVLGAATARAIAATGKLLDCKHQTMLPEAFAELLRGAQSPRLVALRNNCVLGTAAAQGKKLPHPQTLVLRVQKGGATNDALPEMAKKAWSEGHGVHMQTPAAVKWFHAWDIAV